MSDSFDVFEGKIVTKIF